MDPLLTLFDQVGALARRRRQSAERHFAALGLNHTEARLLTLLHQAGGDSPQDALSSQIHVDRSNVGRALKRLEDDGFTDRRRDDSDRRANRVVLTPKGADTVAQIEALRQRMAQTFFGRLTPEQATTILTLLRDARSDEEAPE